MTSYVQADALFWDGEFRTGMALRLTASGATPVPLNRIPDLSVMRRLPGTLLPGLVDAHVHSGLVDLATVRAGGIAGVWDLGSVPTAIAALAARAAGARVARGADAARRRGAGAAQPREAGAAQARWAGTAHPGGAGGAGAGHAGRADPSAAARVDEASAAHAAATGVARAGGAGAAPVGGAAPAGGSAGALLSPTPSLGGGEDTARVRQFSWAVPSIRYAGPFLIAPGGYPSDRSWAAPGSWRAIDSAAEGADAVREAHAGGATLIKMTAHAGGPLLSLPTMTAVAGAAHDLGLPVVVHAEGPGAVVMAYEAGADFLAHTPWTESLDGGLVRSCAERMRWISTLDIHGWGTPTPEQATAVGNLRRFLEYGGSVRYGTDLGNGPLIPGVNAREIRALQSAGLNPAEILAAMTGIEPTTPGDNSTTTAADVCWIPGGLDLDPARFADVLATARVLDDSVRPR
ncbi:amidohydrolase family protein [Actinoplanes sp. CA-030573]|uniref:amidohydrolase family protein n=1 Tax=Actinoplanes sp. CA-030573 TaxID=3239898 RepID=UPI003D91D4AC